LSIDRICHLYTNGSKNITKENEKRGKDQPNQVKFL